MSDGVDNQGVELYISNVLKDTLCVLFGGDLLNSIGRVREVWVADPGSVVA